MSESKYTAAVTKKMRERGAMVYAIVAGAHGADSGWPDRAVVSRQWIGYLEFKGVTTAVRKSQRVVIPQMWKRRPGCVFVIREPESWSRGDPECIVERWDDTTATCIELERCPASQLCWVLERLAALATADDQDATADDQDATADDAAGEVEFE